MDIERGVYRGDERDLATPAEARLTHLVKNLAGDGLITPELLSILISPQLRFVLERREQTLLGKDFSKN